MKRAVKVNLYGNKTTKYTTYSLTPGKIYYVRVRAYGESYDKKIYGVYSKIVRVKARWQYICRSQYGTIVKTEHTAIRLYALFCVFCFSVSIPRPPHNNKAYNRNLAVWEYKHCDLSSYPPSVFYNIVPEMHGLKIDKDFAPCYTEKRGFQSIFKRRHSSAGQSAAFTSQRSWVRAPLSLPT